MKNIVTSGKIAQVLVIGCVLLFSFTEKNVKPQKLFYNITLGESQKNCMNNAITQMENGNMGYVTVRLFDYRDEEYFSKRLVVNFPNQPLELQYWNPWFRFLDDSLYCIQFQSMGSVSMAESAKLFSEQFNVNLKEADGYYYKDDTREITVSKEKDKSVIVMISYVPLIERWNKYREQKNQMRCNEVGDCLSPAYFHLFRNTTFDRELLKNFKESYLFGGNK